MGMREKLVELIRDACDNGKDCATKACWDCLADGLIAKGVVTIPVRCKDCKHYMLWEDSDDKKTCAKSIGLMVSDPDDYCSYGERKDNDRT